MGDARPAGSGSLSMVFSFTLEETGVFESGSNVFEKHCVRYLTRCVFPCILKHRKEKTCNCL